MKRYTVIMAIGVDVPDDFPEKEISNSVALCINSDAVADKLNVRYDIYLEKLDVLSTAIGQIYFIQK